MSWSNVLQDMNCWAPILLNVINSDVADVGWRRAENNSSSQWNAIKLRHNNPPQTGALYPLQQLATATFTLLSKKLNEWKSLQPRRFAIYVIRRDFSNSRKPPKPQIDYLKQQMISMITVISMIANKRVKRWRWGGRWVVRWCFAWLWSPVSTRNRKIQNQQRVG